MARRHPKGMETRDRIMAVALDLFAERGYAAVSMEEVAEGAGVTKGAVYYWFSDKDDLGRDLQHALYERFTQAAVAEFDPDADIVTNMRLAFDTFLAELGTAEKARFFLRDAWTIPALDEGGRRDQATALELVQGVLASAIDRGEIVALDPDALARVLVGAWVEATLHVLTTGDRGPTLAVIEHLVGSLHPATATGPRPVLSPSRSSVREHQTS